ncbi:MAG: EAL domain-containing protein [Actinomycetota bacterium]|nr:EAL domain-containing protein [Actinomycetota bacterium]
MEQPARPSGVDHLVLPAYVSSQLVVICALLLAGSWPVTGDARAAVDGALQALAAGLAAAMILAYAGLHGRTLRTWRLAGLAAVFWCLGQSWLTGQLALTGTAARPSPADALFVVSVGCAVAAALCFPSLPQGRRGRWRLAVDGSVLAGSVLFLVLERLSGVGTSGSAVLSLAYPVADCLIITVLLMAAMRAPRTLLPSLGTAAAGLLVLSVTNLETFRLSLRHLSSDSSPVNAGFALGLALVGLGALLQAAPLGTASEDLMHRGQRLLPYAVVPVVLAVVVASGGSPSGPQLVILAAVAGLLLLRQVLVVEENASLARDVVARARRYEALVQGSTELVLVVTQDAAIAYRSPSVDAALQRLPGGDRAESLLDLVHHDDRATVAAAILACGAHARGTSCRFRFGFGAGALVLEARFTDMTGEPAVAGVVVNARDATQQALAAAALADSERRYRRIVETADEGIWVTDADGITRFANARTAAMIGLSVEDVVGRHALDVLAPLLDEHGISVLRNRMRDRRLGRSSSYEFALTRSDGTRVHTQVSSSPLFDAEGRFDGSLTMITDITARVAAETKLRQDARTDPLTGLTNRTWFTARVADALAAYDPRHPPALVYCDLDGFKAVNDAWGHGAGDELLRRVAERLQSFEGLGVTIGRLGGDEFALLVAATARESEPDDLAARVLAALRVPYALSDREHHVDLSVGIAVADAIDDVESLLRNADLAMYQAKTDGRGRFRRYEHTMHARATARIELEQELRHALARDELLLHYQPVISLESGSCVGAEALIRWQHPTLGLVPPDQFIPLAEGSDLILTIGHWVLERALRDAASWPLRQHPLVLSVNVAPRQLMDDRHVLELARLLRRSDLPAVQVVLEVTERSLLAGHRPREALRTLRQTGARLALDDFGTGYSSIAHLRDHPVDVLKLDRSYVAEVAGKTANSRLALAILDLSRQLGISCTAEGIETEPQALALAKAGCAHAQGFLFARPMPHEALLRWLERPPVSLPSQRPAVDNRLSS